MLEWKTEEVQATVNNPREMYSAVSGAFTIYAFLDENGWGASVVKTLESARGAVAVSRGPELKTREEAQVRAEELLIEAGG